MNKYDLDQIDRVTSLARESLRTAIGALNGTTMPQRAVEALQEFRNACEPALILDLIREWSQRK